MDLPTLYFGAFLGVFPFALAKICSQTDKIIGQRRLTQNMYLYMIWTEAIVNLVFSVTTILYLKGAIHDSFGYFFGTVTLWAIQTQLLSQIIANRVGLIMVNRSKVKWLHLGLFLGILAVNVGVFVIWISAYMPGATPRQVKLNMYFEKAEKSFFLVVDLALNLYFLYLVRFRLIQGGMSKYWKLFKMNVLLIVVSTAMDASLLGMLSLPDPYVYVQFAPLVYIVKLYIELVMANLIAKVASSSVVTRYGSSGGSAYAHHHSRLTADYGREDPQALDNAHDMGRLKRGSFVTRFDTKTSRSGSSSSEMGIVPRQGSQANNTTTTLSPFPSSPAKVAGSILKTTTMVVTEENLSVEKNGSIPSAASSHETIHGWKPEESWAQGPPERPSK